MTVEKWIDSHRSQKLLDPISFQRLAVAASGKIPKGT
jgi:hypothetical protein